MGLTPIMMTNLKCMILLHFSRFLPCYIKCPCKFYICLSIVIYIIDTNMIFLAYFQCL